MKTALRLVEKGLVPEVLLRQGIRSLLRRRLREQRAYSAQDPERALRNWVECMRGAPIALVPEKANEQHYEVPAAFFRLVLGPRLKYSSALYPRADTTLAEAEEAMLALTAGRAGLADGQDVLELGCGWGSLTLWMAQHFPHSRIVAVSNSRPQRLHIEGELERRGLLNVSVVTADMNTFTTSRKFDRVVSVEMFEHMRNWEKLLLRIGGWLRPGARLFLHVFAHRQYAYPFEARDESDWMSRHFFSGGMMPSHGMVDRLETPFESVGRWAVPGTHYARTSEDWLANLEAQRESVLALFESTYGAGKAELWFQRWRVFFLSFAELFAFDGGSEWFVSHELLRLQPANTRAAIDGSSR
jgi:cyclopropane-fatty-acyl-phospholipid synthase